MKKFYSALTFVVLAVFTLSLSGCGGSSSKFSSSTNTNTGTVKQVAVLTSPVFETGKDYQILKGASLTGMKGAKYYIADTGVPTEQATVNLGFLDALGNNDTLVFLNNGKVVFAYDPSGTDNTALTSGTVTADGGKTLSYNSLTVSPAAFFTALNVNTASAKKIILNGSTATMDGTTVNTYDYVWHADPDHADEYYTQGINGDEVTPDISDEVYIAHDIIYMPSGLEYTATVKDDDETEYAAYYSATVSAEVAAKLTALSGDAFGGPYIFATLPGTMGGAPGGNNGGGGFEPGSGDFGGGPGDRPSLPSNVTVSSYNSQIASTISAMTHSASDAYANPVLHITKAGTYSLQGTWNGQIWIDVGEDEADKVSIILNGVTVTCTVAPAIVFHDLYECGPDDEDKVAAASMDVGKDLIDNAGAMVVIADGTTNNFTGANVYRMLKPQAKKSSVTAINGTDVSQQKKRYKMDGAFYSFVSLAIGGGEKADGVLNITSSTYEGFDTEMHLTVESGKITVYAPDDAINVNEDDVSVFTMLDGSLTITSENGDGIDSNGYVVFLGGSLNITAGSAKVNANGEGGIDAEKGTYIYDDSAYTWTAIGNSNGGGGENTPPNGNPGSGDVTPPDGTPGSGDVTPPNGTPGSGDVTPPEGESGNEESGNANIPETTISETPVSTYTSYVKPSDADTSMKIKTSNGTTTFDMGTGSTTSFIEEDTDTSSRNIPSSGNSFPLRRKVNTFWRIQ